MATYEPLFSHLTASHGQSLVVALIETFFANVNVLSRTTPARAFDPILSGGMENGHHHLIEDYFADDINPWVYLLYRLM